MNKLLLTLACFSFLILASCEKDGKGDKDSCNGFYHPEKYVECDAGALEEFDDVSRYHVYILDPLVEDACGCVVEGYVKYRSVETGNTVALVDYGNGECDGWVVINHCFEGDCDKQGSSYCKVALTCGNDVE